MLLKNIGRNLEQTNTLYEQITECIINDAKPSEDSELYNTYYSSRPSFQAKLETYLELSSTTKDKVKSYIQKRITDICTDENCTCKENIPGEDFKVIKELFDYLYDDILSPLLKVHYAELNQQICPFCTINTLEAPNQTDLDAFYREAYDHFLPKSKYPWFAIDMENLAPCCTQCNKNNKKDQDSIELNGNRNKILYPYQNIAKFKINISDAITSNNPERFVCDFQITADPANKQEHLNSYKQLFKLDVRFKNNFMQKLQSWDSILQKGLKDKKIKGEINNPADIKNYINKKINSFDAEKMECTHMFLRIAFYKYQLSRANIIFARLNNTN